MKDLFLLSPDITYLNFGSFGACPQPIFEVYQQMQLELERAPVQFIIKTGIEKLANARQVLSKYIDCDAEDVVYMTNPSYAINTIAKSLKLNAKDEVLGTNHEYGAMDRCWDYYCSKAQATYVRQAVPDIINSKEHFLEYFWRGVSPTTKAVFISHITSASGLIFPVKEICFEARRRGILSIIDGAHAPGQLPLSIRELGCDIYTGACHKWMLSPKGASFLYVRKEHQHWVDPLLISWGFKSDTPSSSQFLDYHQTAGTRDFSAFLTVPFCIDFMQQHNWQERAAACRLRCIQNGQMMHGTFGFEPIAPIGEEFYGQLFSIPIKTKDAVQLKDILFNRYKIEIPITQQGDRFFIRYSDQVFNEQADFDYLLECMVTLQKDGVIGF